MLVFTGGERGELHEGKGWWALSLLPRTEADWNISHPLGREPHRESLSRLRRCQPNMEPHRLSTQPRLSSTPESELTSYCL